MRLTSLRQSLREKRRDAAVWAFEVRYKVGLCHEALRAGLVRLEHVPGSRRYRVVPPVGVSLTETIAALRVFNRITPKFYTHSDVVLLWNISQETMELVP